MQQIYFAAAEDGTYAVGWTLAGTTESIVMKGPFPKDKNSLWIAYMPLMHRPSGGVEYELVDIGPWVSRYQREYHLARNLLRSVFNVKRECPTNEWENDLSPVENIYVVASDWNRRQVESRCDDGSSESESDDGNSESESDGSSSESESDGSSSESESESSASDDSDASTTCVKSSRRDDDDDDNGPSKRART